jgi:hypothetical protein
LRSGFDDRRHGKEADDGFAAADIALEETEHTAGVCEIDVDLAERAKLRRGEPEGERGQNGLPKLARSGEGASGASAQELTDGCERKLVGKKLIIGKP